MRMRMRSQSHKSGPAKTGPVVPATPALYTEQADQVEVEPAYRVYTHPHRLMMGWATELGPRPNAVVSGKSPNTFSGSRSSEAVGITH